MVFKFTKREAQIVKGPRKTLERLHTSCSWMVWYVGAISLSGEGGQVHEVVVLTSEGCRQGIYWSWRILSIGCKRHQRRGGVGVRSG